MRYKLWAGLIIVFVLGVLSGSLGMGMYFKKRVEKFDKRDPSYKANLFTRRLSAELNLTEKQRAEIEGILEGFHMKLSDVKRNVRHEIEKLRERTSEAIRETLNDEQKNAFDELSKRLKRRGSEDRLRADLDRINPERMMSEIKDRLNLTDDQVLKVRPIIESGIKAQRKILEKRGQDRKADRSIRRELREHNMSVEEELSKVLTAEQLVAFRRLQDEQRRRTRPSDFWTKD